MLVFFGLRTSFTAGFTIDLGARNKAVASFSNRSLDSGAFVVFMFHSTSLLCGAKEPVCEYPESGGTSNPPYTHTSYNSMTTDSQDNTNKTHNAQQVPSQKLRRNAISFRRIGKLYLLKLLRLAPDRWIELILSTVIGLVAAVQLYTTVSNNRGTTQQTDQLITAAKYSAYAANQNALASRNFAGSAEGINHEMRDAVGKLGLQAERIEAARQTSEDNSKSALDAAIRQSRLDQRGWVGFSNFTFVVADGKPLKATVRMNISGKSPVVDLQSKTTINWFTKSRIPVLADLLYDPAGRGS